MATRSDSKLVIEQVFGTWKVKNDGLKPLYATARAELQGIRVGSFSHVDRRDNGEADRLCNEALNSGSAPYLPPTVASSPYAGKISSARAHQFRPYARPAGGKRP